jgi:hypothetical protein
MNPDMALYSQMMTDFTQRSWFDVDAQKGASSVTAVTPTGAPMSGSVVTFTQPGWTGASQAQMATAFSDASREMAAVYARAPQ